MLREKLHDAQFIVSETGYNTRSTGTSVPADAVILPGTVMAEPDEGAGLLCEPFTGAVGQEVKGLLIHGVYADQVLPGATLRRTILDGPGAEVTAQGGRIAYPVGVDAAATEALRIRIDAALEARGIRVR